MSGFEVAGLVLAVLPLFISAVKHRRLAVTFLYKTRVLDAFMHKLEVQETLLRLYLQAVIGRTNLAPDHQARLLHDPGGHEWQSDNVKWEVQRQLGEATKMFVETTNQMVIALFQQLKKDDSLHLQSDDGVS